MENEDMSIFKSYLRRLLRDLENLQKALQKKDEDTAEEILKNLIKDTKDGIED